MICNFLIGEHKISWSELEKKSIGVPCPIAVIFSVIAIATKKSKLFKHSNVSKNNSLFWFDLDIVGSQMSVKFIMSISVSYRYLGKEFYILVKKLFRKTQVNNA